ncbi:hypothetical protein GPECTOR_95g692 [Gonium pectorale]|uniref:Uncharacterized protein n=1 Tax=Gonium pectorale TaxID=33097 RepID=A0A150G095_GONPE|nr:hypothetical protein GPECTOR_95g692 [Gonium pectorale]|eukprot:KXZ43303.1 hypothetical protein GPECTOR_95g692 [Gonium pectorale]
MTRGKRVASRASNRIQTEEKNLWDGEKPVVKVDKCVINGKTMQCNHGITVREVFLLGAGPDKAPLGAMPTSRAQVGAGLDRGVEGGLHA